MSHVNPRIGFFAVQAALKSTLKGMRLQGAAVKLYDYDPGMVDDMPCVYMSFPQLVSPDMDQPQRQMGTYDIEFAWPVSILVSANASQLENTHETMAILVTSLQQVIEDNETLSGTAEDCRVISIDPSFIQHADGGNVAMLCECHLHGYYFVNS